MTVDEIVARITDDDDWDESILDTLVHDVKSREASAVNNDGLRAQVEFLLASGCTGEEILAQAGFKPEKPG